MAQRSNGEELYLTSGIGYINIQYIRFTSTVYSRPQQITSFTKQVSPNNVICNFSYTFTESSKFDGLDK
jgi:hypothetical protein